MNKLLMLMTLFTPWSLLLAVLKLAGIISWSWWLVTAPVWAAWFLMFAVLVVVFALGIVLACLWGGRVDPQEHESITEFLFYDD